MTERRAPVPPPLEPTVALAVVTSERGVLLVHRRDRTPPVAFPGGRCEPDEPPTAAAERETREECAIEVVAGQEIGRRVHPVTGTTLIYLACSPRASSADPMLALNEVDAAAWYPLHEALAAMPDIYESVRMHLVIKIGESG